jgi:anti-sigma regulatory factor (Ser/Thr protein kinase)
MERAERVFPPTFDAPRLGRHFVDDALASWDAGDLSDVALLLTSELVTNVVKHAVTPVALAVEWSDPRLRVEVGDGSAIVPSLAEAAGAGGGYGLRILANLAAEWGVASRDDGKTVWFVLERGRA